MKRRNILIVSACCALAAAVLWMHHWHAYTVQTRKDALARAQIEVVLNKFGAYYYNNRSQALGMPSLDPDLIAQLENELNSTSLGYKSLIDLGVIFRQQVNNDFVTAMVFAEAIKRADHDLANLKDEDPNCRSIILTINTARPLLWRLVDHGEQRFLSPLALLSADLAHYIKADDDRLAIDREKGIVGVALCMTWNGDRADALKALEALDVEHMSKEMQANVAWDHGLLLTQLGRYGDAVTYLKLACDAGTHQREAATQLMKAAEAAGNVDAAEYATKILQRTRNDAE